MADNLDLWLYTLGGFFASMIFIPLLLRWLRLALGAIGIRTSAQSSESPKRRLWLLPLLALHPTFLILAALVYFTFKAIFGSLSVTWLWFMGGIFSGFIFFGLLMFILYRRRQHGQKRVGT
jgi:hypothetical protein